MKEKFITIPGLNHYYGIKPFREGRLIHCVKEKNNNYDNDAIKISMPIIGTVGYIANSPYTVIRGTMSASAIYRNVENDFFARVMFILKDKVICKVIDGEHDKLKKEYIDAIVNDDEEINEPKVKEVINIIDDENDGYERVEALYKKDNPSEDYDDNDDEEDEDDLFNF